MFQLFALISYHKKGTVYLIKSTVPFHCFILFPFRAIQGLIYYQAHIEK